MPQCPDCDDGEVVDCIDDMCAGSDRCIHGDGYGPCGRCKGTGWLGDPDDYGDEDEPARTPEPAKEEK
jgi:hypothetical protein